MTPHAPTRERTWVVLASTGLAIASLAIAHDLLALGLDRLGLVERLLSPSGLDAVLALIAALVLFGLRLALLVLAPALVLGLVGAWVTTLVLRRPPPRRGPRSSRTRPVMRARDQRTWTPCMRSAARRTLRPWSASWPSVG
jgi:hypothetical protein